MVMWFKFSPYRYIFLFLYSLLFVISCASPSVVERQNTANKIAMDADFQKVSFDTNLFRLHGWKKNTLKVSSEPLIIYIEGDGKAWASRFKVSNNPTPVNPVSLRLAVQDIRSNVMYLARPCQYEKTNPRTHCQPKIWTSHRYSQEVINAYNRSLEQIKKQYGVKEFELIGFSGGGVIATLLAAQRYDVTNITTVASNLDHIEWTAHHRVTPLHGSLKINSHLSELTDVRQVNLFGAEDSIVPFKVNKNLLKHLLKNNSAFYEVYDNFDHFCCWAEHWHNILRKNNSLPTNKTGLKGGL